MCGREEKTGPKCVLLIERADIVIRPAEIVPLSSFPGLSSACYSALIREPDSLPHGKWMRM